MRGQLSIEFMVVFTTLLIILATVTMPVYECARADAERAAKLADAREAANAIAGALNAVYAGGVGSQQTVEYRLPESVSSISFENGPDNRICVRIVLSLNGENTVQVSTLLSGGEDENRIVLSSENFGLSPGPHRMRFTYEYGGGLRRIEMRVA